MQRPKLMEVLQGRGIADYLSQGESLVEVPLGST